MKEQHRIGIFLYLHQFYILVDFRIQAPFVDDVLDKIGSLAVQYYAKPEIVAIVPPNCFMPRPNVGSAVIRLTRHKEVPVQVNDEKLMFKIIRASFNQRRKTLANGLNNAPDIHLSKEVIQESIEELGVPVTIRGEALTLQQFAILL